MMPSRNVAFHIVCKPVVVEVYEAEDGSGRFIRRDLDESLLNPRGEWLGAAGTARLTPQVPAAPE
jgi:hypothetical protein